jgi:FkbM family methyltransferase
MDFGYIKNLVYSDIYSVLDVGAHFGLFTKTMHEVFPNAKYFMIEANEQCEDKLKEIYFADYMIELLSDREDAVIYYMNKNDPTSTGNSYYKEISNHFTDDNVNTVIRKSKTLDSIFKNEKFDFIKLDTQGSELDILRGGNELIKNTHSVLIECSVIPYNQGAPLVEDVCTYMKDIGFNIQTIIEEHIIDNECVQRDILFQR